MAREMKDSGVVWIGEIPADWDVLPLKRLCSMQAGKNLISEQIKLSGEYPVYGGNGLRGYFDEFNNDGEYLLVGRQGALCGNVHRVAGRFWATEHAIVTSTSPLVKADFLYYLLTAIDLNQYASDVAAQPGLSVNSILNVKTCSTSFAQQIRIAAFLDKKCAEIDAVLEKTRTSIEEYKKLKQAIITQAVTKGVRGDRPMKESGIEWMGSCPADWTIIKIKWLLEEGKDRSIEGTEEPLSMSQKYGILPTREMDLVPNMASSFVGAKLVHKGDLVFNKLKAHLGVFAVSGYDGLVSPDYAVYRTTNLANAAFLEYLFKTPQYISEFKKKSTGIAAGLTRLYTDGLYSIFCALPSLAEQQEIIRYLQGRIATMDALIQKKEQFLIELESYKKSLIYEYVTGKKEV